MLGHLQHRQQVFQLALGVARGVVAEHCQGIVVVGDGGSEVLRQAPGLGGEVADHRMVGIEGAVFGIHHPRFAAGLGIGFFQHLHVAGEALEHQRHATVVEQAQGVGLVRGLDTGALGQGQAGHRHVLGGVPEAVEGNDGLVAHLAFDRLGVDQVDDRTAAQQVHRTLDRTDLVGQAKMRRIDQLEQGAGQPWVLGNQLGDGFQVRVRHVLLELQVNHDLRLRRDGDALQGLLDLFGAEFLGHTCTLV